MINKRELEILDFIRMNQGISSTEILRGISTSMSYATVKRLLSGLIEENLLTKRGQGKSTKYFISPAWQLLSPVNIDHYFEREIDERDIQERFNFNLISGILQEHRIFTTVEMEKLEILQSQYINNVTQLSETAYKKELERLAIDLSWKSSQIEGNTYSLLETERLLKEKETASGKTKEEAIMLLNHKEAIDFLIEDPDYLNPISISGIEDLHTIITKELGVDKNIRKGRVGISGTNYRPLENPFQITESLNKMCDLVNNKENIFEKAILALVLISYIQPFVDGNKRTARIISNAVLMNHGHCPISFRTADSVDYKKALLLFYERNNIAIFKQLFIDQFEFAANTYF